MVNQRLLPNYTSTPPPDEIENAFVPINTVTKEKTSLIRHDEMRLMTGNSENTDPHLKYLSEIMLPPTPDQDDMMPSPPSSHDDEDLFDILLKQRNQLHRAETMQTQKKRPRVDSLLTPCNSLSSDDNTFEGIHEEWTEEEEKVTHLSKQNHPIPFHSMPSHLTPIQTINKPYNYLTSHSGKDIRKQILAAFNIWLKIDTTHLNTINKVVGMLHNASLLIDDIQDSSPLRRGAPSAHTIFGTASTINSANYVYFQAMQTLSTLPTQVIPGALQIYCEELLNLHRGQGLDLYWRDTLTLPTESAYLKMVANKTGGLFRLAVRLMCLVSNCSFDFAPLIEKLGLIFQIRDDYKNLVSDTVSSLPPSPFSLIFPCSCLPYQVISQILIDA